METIKVAPETLWPKLLKIAETKLLVRAIVDRRSHQEVVLVTYTVHTNDAGAMKLGLLVYHYEPPDADGRFQVQLASRKDLWAQWLELTKSYEPSWLKRPCWFAAQQAVAVGSLRNVEGQAHEIPVVPESNLLMQVYSRLDVWITWELRHAPESQIAWLTTYQARLRSWIHDCNNRLEQSGDLIKFRA